MKSFVRELRRREVFRTAGLYVGIAWITIEVSSVLLPAFDAPAWVLRWLVAAALVGFPVALVLAWVFDVTEHGIVVQRDSGDGPVPPLGGRRTDFVVIAVLSIALVVSVFLNFSGEPAATPPAEPVTVIVNNFAYPAELATNVGALEIVVANNLERAALLDVYEPQWLETTADYEQQAAREAATLLVDGTVVTNGSQYRLSVVVRDAGSGEELASANGSGESGQALVAAAARLITGLLEDLALDTANNSTIESGSLPALAALAEAKRQLQAGQTTQAAASFALAVERDPGMAEGWACWGLLLQRQGQALAAQQKWQRALPLLNGVSARQRDYFLGRYYAEINIDHLKAIEHLDTLLQSFPADAEALVVLARLQAVNARHGQAFALSARLVELYPSRATLQAAHAGYALRAGRVELAAAIATRLRISQPEFAAPLRILAAVALYQNDVAAALLHYDSLATLGPAAASTAVTGRADIDMLEGRPDQAVALLAPGITDDQADNLEHNAVRRQVLLASAYVQGNDVEKGLQLLREVQRSFKEPLADAALVPMAEIFVARGLLDEVIAVADALAERGRPAARAYAGLLQGMVAAQSGAYPQAINTYTGALREADLWLLRYYLGQAYLAAGYPAEASAEFENCVERRGEASELFLDGEPTWRYTRDLPVWKRSANDALAGSA